MVLTSTLSIDDLLTRLVLKWPENRKSTFLDDSNLLSLFDVVKIRNVTVCRNDYIAALLI